MKLFELRDKKDYFTELIKIENFTTVKEVLERINKWIEGVDDLSDYDECDLCNTKDKDGKDYKYVQISGDGTCYFVELLSEFNGKYKTEDGWGVEYGLEI